MDRQPGLIPEDDALRFMRAQAAWLLGQPVPIPIAAPVPVPAAPTRDTDADWVSIAKDAPYYGVFSQERYRTPDATSLKDLFETGEREIAHFEQTLRRQFGSFSPTSALDFGCGVGRLLIPLARRAGRAYGVDVAPDMLALSRKHATEAGVSVEVGHDIPARQFDWVNTVIVLQHIPPARGYQFIRSLWNCVAPGGALTMHVTIYKEPGLSGAPISAAPGMSMYDYDLSRVLEIMQLPDGAPIYMERTNHGGFHGVRMFVRAPRRG